MKEKINHSLELIRKASLIAEDMTPEVGLWIAYSGGKDSECVLDLVKKAGVHFTAFYNVTGIDAPDSVHFIQKNHPEVKFLHPKRNYFQLVEFAGMPTMNRRFCCDKIKESTGAGHVVLTGVRASESKKREKLSEVRLYSRRRQNKGKDTTRQIDEVIESQHQCIQGKDRLMVHPIFQWTESDVWHYMAKNSLPINPMYDEVGRVGCMYCPFARQLQIENYEKLYPTYRKRVILAIERNLLKKNEIGFADAEDCFMWWKSKMSVNQYFARKKNLPSGPLNVSVRQH